MNCIGTLEKGGKTQQPSRLRKIYTSNGRRGRTLEFLESKGGSVLSIKGCESHHGKIEQ